MKTDTRTWRLSSLRHGVGRPRIASCKRGGYSAGNGGDRNCAACRRNCNSGGFRSPLAQFLTRILVPKYRRIPAPSVAPRPLSARCRATRRVPGALRGRPCTSRWTLLPMCPDLRLPLRSRLSGPSSVVGDAAAVARNGDHAMEGVVGPRGMRLGRAVQEDIRHGQGETGGNASGEGCLSSRTPAGDRQQGPGTQSPSAGTPFPTRVSKLEFGRPETYSPGKCRDVGMRGETLPASQLHVYDLVAPTQDSVWISARWQVEEWVSCPGCVAIC